MYENEMYTCHNEHREVGQAQVSAPASSLSGQGLSSVFAACCLHQLVHILLDTPSLDPISPWDYWNYRHMSSFTWLLEIQPHSLAFAQQAFCLVSHLSSPSLLLLRSLEPQPTE